MDDRILSDALAKKGILSQEVSSRVLSESLDARAKFEDLLYAKRLVTEEVVAGVKAEILGIPFHSVKPESIDENVFKLIPQETAVNYKVVPLSLENKLLTVGMVNPDDSRAQEALRFVAKEKGVSLGAYLITPTNLEIILRRYVSYKSEIESALRAVNIKSAKGAAAEKFVALEEGIAVSDEAPIIRIVSSTLRNAVADGASDIHIEPQRGRSRVRFRIDGRLQEKASLPVELHQPVISRIKILSDLKIDETRIPQDGRFRTLIFGRDIDFRVATFPTPAGEKVAIRVLDPSVGLKGMESLGLQDRARELVESAIKKPFGMILVTGPTGSGKSTTLYSLLQSLNDEDTNIVSLEDPVEYFVDGVNQSQVHPDIGYDFSSGLRQILRQDPDVIMVGEIRDTETAQLAVHAALTGHIVLSTLHTNNAIGVIPRLVDMEVDSFLLPSALNLMIAQRLVRRLCESCKKEKDMSQVMEEIVKRNIDALPAAVKSAIGFKSPYKVYGAPGCKVCAGKGIVGRIAIFEVLEMTRELGAIISRDVNEAKILEQAKRQGIVSMRQDGIIKALRGLVSLEEILRETEEL